MLNIDIQNIFYNAAMRLGAITEFTKNEEWM